MLNVRFPPASNRADWRFWLTNTDPNDGSMIGLSVDQITLAVSRPDCLPPLLSAAPGDGKITSPSTGVFEVRFPASEMRQLAAGTYEVGAIIFDGTDTAQLIIGTVPVINGVVR